MLQAHLIQMPTTGKNILLILLLSTFRWSVGSPSFPVYDRFSKVDVLFAQRKNGQCARQALEGYRQIYNEFPADPQAGWRYSMANYFVGMRLTTITSDKQSLFAAGRDAGLQALRQDPKCAACHFWAAVNMSLYGESVGVVKMLFSLREIQTLLKKSIELDPSYAYGGAYRVLGIIEDKLPGILGGSEERAREYFKLAVTAAPQEPMNYLFFSKLLAKSKEGAVRALATAKRGLFLSKTDSESPESDEAREELRSFVETREPNRKANNTGIDF